MSEKPPFSSERPPVLPMTHGEAGWAQDLSACIQQLKFNADGLIPVVVQDRQDRSVLMLGWMDAEALARTATSGRATYWSRSRQEYWRKGDTSSHVQEVISIQHDCDADTILLTVRQTGPACHTGSKTCFDARFIPHIAPFDSPGAKAKPSTASSSEPASQAQSTPHHGNQETP